MNAAYEQLWDLLGGGWVLYAEWLWLTHTFHYDHLPDHLVALDLWHPDRGFVARKQRDERVRASTLVVPPHLFSGALGSAGALIDLIGVSHFGTEPMEGVVLRRDDGRRCKVLRPGFVRAAVDHIDRARNELAGPGEG